ncbi:uncharacterized protein [Euwallacea fornicatus]|uniref:uncharacterized protein n=1 Tax=Euwallacea fornicatus TaxID=995702 RepID=UPI00338ECF19
MGLCCSRTCDDEEPAREPLINRGSVRHESSIVPALEQPHGNRSPAAAPYETTRNNSHSRINAAPKRGPTPNVTNGTKCCFPQPNSLRSNVTAEQPAREPPIDATPRRRTPGSAPVFPEPIVEQRSKPSLHYGTFVTPSKDVNPEINHWPSVRSVCDEEMLIELLKTFQTHHIPYIPKFGAYGLETLDRKSKRFVMKSLFRNRKFLDTYEICSVKRVWNPYLMLQYMLNKCKYEYQLKEYHMYHGTSLIAGQCIMEQNFNWRMVKEFTCGKGVYFANNPFLASHFGKKRCTAAVGYYIMIVAKVLIEEREIERGFPHVLPAAGHSTISKSNQEIVKFDDCLFYPEFLVYYKPTDDKI